MASDGLNGNTDYASPASILSDVWDESRHVLRMGAGSGALVVSKVVTYSGGTLNDPGDFDGTGTPLNLFTVTGQVLLSVIAVCSVALTGAGGTFSVGKLGSVTRYVPTVTGTTMGIGDVADRTGKVTAGTAVAVTPNQVATNGEVVTETVATADITAGVLTYYAFYTPLSVGATVVAN